MNKTLKIASIIIILIAIGATGWFLVTKKSQNDTNLTQKNVEVKNQSRQEKKQQANNSQNQAFAGQKSNVKSQKSVDEKIEDIDTSDWKTYRNKEFGFEMKLPGDPKKWNVKVKHVDKEHSKYKGDEYFLGFYYEIDAKIPDVIPVPNDPSKVTYLKRKNDRLILLNIVPVKYYTDDVKLLNLHKPIPPIGIEIGRNEKFVFLKLPASLTEPLCTYVSIDERQNSDFCRIENIFATATNTSELINFKAQN